MSTQRQLRHKPVSSFNCPGKDRKFQFVRVGISMDGDTERDDILYSLFMY